MYCKPYTILGNDHNELDTVSNLFKCYANERIEEIYRKDIVIKGKSTKEINEYVDGWTLLKHIHGNIKYHISNVTGYSDLGDIIKRYTETGGDMSTLCAKFHEGYNLKSLSKWDAKFKKYNQIRLDDSVHVVSERINLEAVSDRQIKVDYDIHVCDFDLYVTAKIQDKELNITEIKFNPEVEQAITKVLGLVLAKNIATGQVAENYEGFTLTL